MWQYKFLIYFYIYVDEISFGIIYIIMYFILVKQVMRIKNLELRERDFVYRCNCYQNMPPFAHVKLTALLLYRNYNAARPVWIIWFINMWPLISASCFTPHIDAVASKLNTPLFLSL